MKKNILIVLLILLSFLSMKMPKSVYVKYGPYDESDLENIKQFVMEWKEPTYDDLTKYDITKDGSITQMDYFYAFRMVKGAEPNPKRFKYVYTLKIKTNGD